MMNHDGYRKSVAVIALVIFLGLIYFNLRQNREPQLEIRTIPSPITNIPPEIVIDNTPTPQPTYDPRSELSNSIPACPPRINITPTQSQQNIYSENGVPYNAAMGITFEQAVKQSALPPQTFRVKRLSDGTIQTSWYQDRPFIKKFNIYRRERDREWTKVGEVNKTPRTVEADFSFIDRSGNQNTTYIYAVTTVSIHDDEGGCSDQIELPMVGN